MVYHFNHRFADYGLLEPGSHKHVLPNPSVQQLQDPFYSPLPRYWVPELEVSSRLADKWSRGWLLGWRDVTDSRASARTVNAAIIPRVGVGHTMPLLLSSIQDPPCLAALLCNLSSFVFDFAARQKIGGTHLTYAYLKQLPLLPPEEYSRRAPWNPEASLAGWIRPHAVELTCTAEDLAALSHDLGYEGVVFRWDGERRFLLRCELDAAFFHLYGIDRDDVDYIMETFPIVRRTDEEAHGEYRTKRVILEIYDAMAEAIRGKPYKTLLDPPPADPAVAHVEGDENAGAVG